MLKKIHFREFRKIRKITFLKFAQYLYLNIKFFMKNRLFSYAGACSYSFLFSFIPVFMMIVVILIRFLHASPVVVETLFKTIPELEKYISTDKVIMSIQSINSIRAFEIIIGIFIIWMARRFFASIFDSLQNIFHEQINRGAIKNQFLMLGIEAITIIIVAGITFAYIIFQSILDLPIISDLLRGLPQLSFFFNGFLLSNFIKYFPNILLLVVLFVIYKAVPGTKPKKEYCFFSAFLCTFSFFIFRIIIHHFLNSDNYNFIYGVLGQVIITLIDIYTFFTLFLFFAQFIFVCQFFDELIIGEIYLLPKRMEVGFFGCLKILLFINPVSLLSKKENILTVGKDEIIFDFGAKSLFAYYVVEGKVEENRNNVITTYSRGDFFGEIGCILKKYRNSTVKTLADSKIIKIDSDTFKILASKNPEIAKKVFKILSQN